MTLRLAAPAVLAALLLPAPAAAECTLSMTCGGGHGERSRSYPDADSCESGRADVLRSLEASGGGCDVGSCRCASAPDRDDSDSYSPPPDAAVEEALRKAADESRAREERHRQQKEREKKEKEEKFRKDRDAAVGALKGVGPSKEPGLKGASSDAPALKGVSSGGGLKGVDAPPLGTLDMRRVRARWSLALDCAMSEVYQSAGSLGAAGKAFKARLARDLRELRDNLPATPPHGETGVYELLSLSRDEQVDGAQVVVNALVSRERSSGVTTVHVLYSAAKDPGAGERRAGESTIHFNRHGDLDCVELTAAASACMKRPFPEAADRAFCPRPPTTREEGLPRSKP